MSDIERSDADLTFTPPPHQRRIFCNRTLNLRAIRAIGYDMDYTLVHYHERLWEQRAYEHMRGKLEERGWPVAGLRFDPELMERGLVVDTQLGNILKANRFGFLKRALHGTRPMDYERVRHAYARSFVHLAEERYIFLNTLFSLSKACMYAQLVDLLDAKELPEVLGYADLFSEVKRSLDAAHMEGQLKAEIIQDPDRFVDLDPDAPLALLDQRHAGKKLLLITNSEWSYTRFMMRYAYDRYLPEGMTWRDLFDIVIVSARKPDFFSTSAPIFEVVDENEGLLRPVVGPLQPGRIHVGGNASLLEEHLGLSGDQLLYVGDHLFTDVHLTKSLLRWRTALILRELEREMDAVAGFEPQQRQLSELMQRKEALEYEQCQLRLQRQRQAKGCQASASPGEHETRERLARLRSELEQLDAQIAPLAQASAEVSNATWGPLMRAGNDKSLLTRQVERYADIYTSRISNFLFQTPFAYLRSARGSLPHDP